MCNKTLLVPIPDFLKADYAYIFESGEHGPHKEFDIDTEGRQCFAIDACIVPAVLAMWEAGIRTVGSCCGHGSGHGVISFDLPNGGDVERRRNQTNSFYERNGATTGRIHKFA